MSKQKCFKVLGCLLLVLLLVLAVGCGKEDTANTNTPAMNRRRRWKKIRARLKKGLSGGTLRYFAAGPTVLSYYRKWDRRFRCRFRAAEMLVAVSNDRTHEPQLAEWFEEDPEARTITFKLRKD